MATPRHEGDARNRILSLAPHLHQQIVFPLMAAALVVAVVATAVGVTEMSKIIGKWVDGKFTGKL